MTIEGEALFRSVVHEVGAGLEKAAGTDTGADVTSVVGIFEEISGAGGEAVTVDVTDTVTGALLEDATCKLLTQSCLIAEDWVKAEGMGGLCTTGVVVAKAAGGAATGLVLLTDAVVLGVSVISEASLGTIDVSVGLAGGAFTGVAGVFGGAVVVEVKPEVVVIVIGGEDIIGAEMFINGVVEGFVDID